MSPMIPMNEAMLASALTMFLKVSAIMTTFVSVVFIVRSSLLVSSMARVDEYVDLLKGTILYFGLINLFPLFIKIIISFSGTLSKQISFIEVPEAQEVIKVFLDRLFGEYIFLKIFGSIGDIIVLGIANAFYTSFIGLLLCIAPIVIFLNSMLGLSHGLKSYLTVFVSLCLWPTLWNLLGLLGKELTGQLVSSPISVILFWFVIQLLQVLSPLFCVALFKSMSASGVITKTVTKGASIAGGKWI